MEARVAHFRATIPSVAEPTKPTAKLISTCNNWRRPGYLPLTRGRGHIYLPQKKKTVPPSKPKGIVIGAPATSAPFISEEEEEPILRGIDFIPLLPNVPMEEVDEENN